VSQSDYLRDVFEYGIDARSRRVFLQTHLGPASEDDPTNIVEYVTRGLLVLDRTPGPIELWVHSPGGEVSDALAIYDVVQTLSNPVHTVGHGDISSAAVLLLAGGTGTRYVMANAYLMAHEGEADLASGPIALQEIQLAQRKKIEKRWAELMGRCTRPKRTARWWAALADRKPELYLDAAGMISHGVADEVWS
jgi:ATP-dependent Clp protease protease subunit